jgi:3-hydroxyisobutyrate dehydrogenase
MDVGFIGLGVMGQPMAVNLAKSGVPLLVWTRDSRKADPVRDAGARVAATAADVCAHSEIVILMLADGDAVNAVLGAPERGFQVPVAGRTIVNMGTVSPAFSSALADRVRTAGGSYVEAPVSGSRTPAEAGELVAMLAGDDADVGRIAPLLAPMCSRTFSCGLVPKALLMKLSVNLFLITMVTGLAESFHFAESHGLDTGLLRDVLNAGPMASAVSTIKLGKLVAADFSVQASVSNVLMNNRLVAEAARLAGVASPLLDACKSLYAQAEALGHGGDDMAAVVHALRAPSSL